MFDHNLLLQSCTMADTNTLVSTAKTSDTGLRALLHPLVLLTISDYITRHTLRLQTQPIVGALLGQQNGREVSIEHAYEVKIMSDSATSEPKLDQSWFADRLQQYKDVHKAPVLDLVGWWTTCPSSGPTAPMLGIHREVMSGYNESALLVAFHPARILAGETAGGKLPLTIYESVYESGKSGDVEIQSEMQIDAGEGNAEELEFKFRELAYEVVTGEAEMIGVDFVARGSGNAGVVDGSAKAGRAEGRAPVKGETKSKEKDKGKAKMAEGQRGTAPVSAEDSSVLSAEDEERTYLHLFRSYQLTLVTDSITRLIVIAFLSTRANAIKMLHSRILLLRSYLAQLPPSYLTGSDSTALATQPATTSSSAPISHPLLRSIQSLLTRLPLLIPPDIEAFKRESLAEKSDVSLVALLGSLGQSIKEARELGAKFGVVENGRQSNNRKGGFPLMGGGGGFGASVGFEEGGDLAEGPRESMWS